MSAPLILVLVVGVAYLAAHVAFDWIARRFLVVSGAEYLVLGILLGPQLSGVLSAEMVESFAPLTTLALGWVGALVGTQFVVRELVRIPGLLYRLAFIQSLATLAVVAALLLAALVMLFDVPSRIALIPAVALGAVAAASSPASIEVVARLIGHRGAVMRQLQVAAAIDSLVAISAFGLLVCLRHPDAGTVARPMTPTEWAVISVGIGLVGGALFHLFVGAERHADRLFVALSGAIVLASGAAAYLRLSPLLTTFVVGATLANTSSNRDRIVATLARAERPFYFVLLIFAGAAWEPSLRSWPVPVLLFLLARIAGKVGGARLGARLNGALPALGAEWGWGLVGQGGLALAIALDYVRRDDMPLRGIVFTAAIASVLLTELFSAHVVRSVVDPLLLDARQRRLAAARATLEE